MSADRISTSGQVVLKSESAESNLNSGGGTTRIYTGSKAQMIAQNNVEAGLGASMLKLESTGDGNYQLTAGYSWNLLTGSTSSGGEIPINSHELENCMSQVDVWTNKKLQASFLSAFSTWSAANAAISFVQGRVDDYKSSKKKAADITDAEGLITGAYSGAQQSLALNTFRGIALHQVSNSIQFDSVYRRRITAASYNQVQASFIGVDKIWTTAEILSFENVPSAWWFQLPPSYQWLKAKPVVVTVAQNKTEISYSYLAFVQAWGVLYDAYGSATLVNF